jgi:hypothetical protein
MYHIKVHFFSRTDIVEFLGCGLAAVLGAIDYLFVPQALHLAGCSHFFFLPWAFWLGGRIS